MLHSTHALVVLLQSIALRPNCLASSFRQRQSIACSLAPAPKNAQERAAIRWRIAQLRQEIGSTKLEIRQIQRHLGVAGKRRSGWAGELARATETIVAAEWRSTSVLVRQLQRQRDPWSFLADETGAILRLATDIKFMASVFRKGDAIMPHVPAIYSRARELEPYIPGMVRIIDVWLPVIEPHLDLILERFDEIEPHLPYVMEHIDELAPHCGPLLKHIDELLLFSDEDEAYLPLLLPYLPYFAPKLDAIGPHLPLLRPHLPLILPVLPYLYKHVDRFVPHVAASANADLLVFYFGWVLRIPLLRRIIYVPGFPRMAAAISRILPKRPVRGQTADYECDWEECDISYVSNAMNYYVTSSTAQGDVQAAVEKALGARRAQRALEEAELEQLAESDSSTPNTPARNLRSLPLLSSLRLRKVRERAMVSSQGV